jgi:hypothetical protein
VLLSSSLAAHPRVQVLWLPTYAAHEVNPVERLWGLMKADVAANRLAGSIEELAAKARRFFADLAAHPVDLPPGRVISMPFFWSCA